MVCAAFGFLIGLPALRLAGHHLALTTFALAVAVPQVLKYKLFEDWTGGVQGLVIDKPDPPFGLPLSSDQWLYLFSLGVAVLMYVLAWNLVRGRIGRAMKAIRDHATAAEAMGINLAMVKTRTFAVSAMYTGVAGSIGAIVVAFVAPDSFSVFLSITLFVGLCAGGAASIPGTIVGAIVYRVRAEHRRTDFQGGAGRDLRRDPDRDAVPDADRGRVGFWRTVAEAGWLAWRLYR